MCGVSHRWDEDMLAQIQHSAGLLLSQTLWKLLQIRICAFFQLFVCGAVHMSVKGEAAVTTTFDPLSRCCGFEHIKDTNPEWSCAEQRRSPIQATGYVLFKERNL